MPFQDVALEHVAGMEVFGSFDFVTGLSQILNHPDMKEILSVRTPIGVMTPDRMPMGHVDSALYFQAMVEMVFGDMVGDCCAVWFDDILLYGRNFDEYIANLSYMLDRLESDGFKLSLKIRTSQR